MRKIGNFILYIVLVLNMVVLAFMLLSAFSSYVDPARFPVLSCLGLVYIIFFVINLAFAVFWLIARPAFILVPVFGIVLTWGAFRSVFPVNKHDEPVEKALTVLSYNVMGFKLQQADLKEKRNKIVRYIQDCDADIVCLQEYILSEKSTHLSEKDLIKKLSGYKYHKSLKVGGESNKNKIACFSKYPILECEKIDYSSLYNGSAIFKLKIGGDTVIVINNHLESNKLTQKDRNAYNNIINTDDPDSVKSNIMFLARKLADAAAKRVKQAEAVAEKVKYYDKYPVIVCGDFNDGPLSLAHRIICEGLSDAFVEKGFGLGISYNQNRFYFRIDNILLNSRWNVYSCEVDNSIKDSDHYPIKAVVGLKR